MSGGSTGLDGGTPGMVGGRAAAIGSWQLCPLCQGSGGRRTPGPISSERQCPVCVGKRVINTYTGRPPR